MVASFPSLFRTFGEGLTDHSEIKVPSVENTELKDSPFKAWSRSVYGHMYMLRLLPGISSLLIYTLLVQLPAFFPKHLPVFFPVLAVANTGSV